MPKLKCFYFFLLMTIIVSCSSPLDFSQAENVTIKPAITGNISYFDVAASKFIDNQLRQVVILDTVNFDLFKGTFFKDNLKKLDLFMEIKNNIDRELIVESNLIDENKKVLKSINYQIPYFNGEEKIIKKLEIFEGVGIETLINTQRISYKLIIENNHPNNPNNNKNVVFKSYADLYFNIE
jgi:hypothetical protein